MKDLIIIVVWAIILFVAVLATDSVVVRVLLSLPILFLPGYAVLRSLGIVRESLLEQMVYSIGASIAFCIMGGFLLNTIGLLTPIGWAAWFVAITGISAFTGRRRTLPWNLAIAVLPAANRSHLAIIGIAVCIVVASYVLAVHDEAQTRQFIYTDFWMVPAPGKLIVGVKSEETKPQSFNVEVTLRGQIIADWRSIRLDPGDGWTRVVDLPVVSSYSKADAVLYRSPNHVIYRKVSAIIPSQ